ncbi:MAG: transposase [Amaricoccus sp.]
MAARIALVERYLAHFPASTIRVLLADRAFVGAAWLEFLNDNNIPFAIRLREDLRIVTDDGCELTRFARMKGRQRSRTVRGRLRSKRKDGDRLRLRRQAPPRRLARHRLQPAAPARPRRPPPPLGDRVHVRRRQDPRPRHRGHPPHLSAQARPPHGHRRHRPRLGRTRCQRGFSADARRSGSPTASSPNPTSGSASPPSEASSGPSPGAPPRTWRHLAPGSAKQERVATLAPKASRSATLL